MIDFDQWVEEKDLLVAKKMHLPRYCWVDIETTGLDMFQDHVLEVGLVLSNEFGEVIPNSFFSTLVFPPLSPKAVWNRCDPFAAEMHQKSGLEDDWWAVDDSIVDANTYQLVDKHMRDWVSAFANPKDLTWAGSTIEFDKTMIKRTMPKFGDSLNYRSVNVSSLKELAKHLNRPVFEGFAHTAPESRHRPMHCLADSLTEFQYYLNEFLMADWTEHDAE